MTITPDFLEETAVHEAGHAIVGFAWGLKFNPEKAITIIPDSDFQGRVLYEQLPLRKLEDWGSVSSSILEQEFSIAEQQAKVEAPASLCAAFAGPLAVLLTSQADGIADRVLGGTKLDVRSAAGALLWMTQSEKMWQILTEGCMEPIGPSFIEFYRQFCEAMNQVRMPQPQIVGDPVIFKVLHSAARSALEILEAYCDLLDALKSKLLEVKCMTGAELTSFLKPHIEILENS